MSAGRDPYGPSLAVTLVFFYGAAAVLAWLAHRWPVGFAGGVLLFFLLVYGKLSWLWRFLRRGRARPRGAP